MKKSCIQILNRILSQVPIILVLLDLHFEGIEGVDKAESQNHLLRGNQLLNAGQLAEALTHYHAAVDKDEHNYQAYYMRATVYLAMGKARSALPDLNQVVKLQPTFIQARLQRGNLFLKMGKFNEAQLDYEAMLAEEDNVEATARVEEIRPLRRSISQAQKFLEANDFAAAIDLLNAVIDTCPWNSEYREMRATAYEQMGDLRRAISDLKPTTILKLDNTVAYYKMSVLWYRLGDIEQSLDEIRECLKLDPDHSQCYAHYKSVKKLFKTMEAGKSKMAENEWEEAIVKFKKVLSQESHVASLTIEVKLKICECYVKANIPEQAIAAADDVLALDSSNIPALSLKSEAHTQTEDYQQALDDLQKASEIDENYPGLREKLQKAQKLLKQSKKRDYYKILGVPRNAQKKDIIKAYRKLAREWHPDNFQDEKDKKTAEKKFIEIASAKEVLSDPEKVRIYNDGFDPLNADDVKEWEKEKNLERTSNLFEFFFQHKSKGGKSKADHQTPFEDLFRSFNSENPKRFHDQKTFEQQFKNSKEYLTEQARKKQVEEQKRQEEMILKQQHQELQRHQQILMHQQHEQMRLEAVLKQQQEEERRREMLKRQKEEQERQERIRQQKIEEEEKIRSQQAEQQQQTQYSDRPGQGYHSNPHQDSRYAGSDKQKYNNARRDSHQSYSDYGRANSAKDRRSFTNNPDAQYGYRQGQHQRQAHDKSTTQAYEDRYKSQDYANRGNQARNFQQGPRSAYRDQTSSDQSRNPSRAHDPEATKTRDKRKYTKGTDGRWYFRGGDGRWKVADHLTNSDRGERKSRPNSPSNSQSTNPSRESYTDKNGKVYVRGTDGNWYMRVDSTSGSQFQQTNDRNTQQHQQQTGQYQQQQRTANDRRSQQGRHNHDHSSHQRSNDPVLNLPHGLFRNDRGHISDRIGNLYERLQDGRYRVVLTAAAAKERLKEQLRSHKQADLLRQNRDSTPPQQAAPKQQIYHDAAGSVYVKDSLGNLIKVKPGQQERRSSASPDPKDGYSYRDPDVAWQQKRWQRPNQESTFQQQFQQQQHRSYHNQDQRRAYSEKQGYQHQPHRNRPLHEEL